MRGKSTLQQGHVPEHTRLLLLHLPRELQARPHQPDLPARLHRGFCPRGRGLCAGHHHHHSSSTEHRPEAPLWERDVPGEWKDTAEREHLLVRLRLRSRSAAVLSTASDAVNDPDYHRGAADHAGVEYPGGEDHLSNHGDFGADHVGQRVRGECLREELQSWQSVSAGSDGPWLQGDCADQHHVRNLWGVSWWGEWLEHASQTFHDRLIGWLIDLWQCITRILLECVGCLENKDVLRRKLKGREIHGVSDLWVKKGR